MRELVLSVMKDALQFTNINPNDDDEEEEEAVEEAETDGDKSGQQSENENVSETLENAKEDSDATTNDGNAGKGWIIFKCAELSLIEGIIHHTITSIPKISFKSPLS